MPSEIIKLKKLSSSLNIPYKTILKYFTIAKKEAREMGEEDNFIYVVDIMKELLDLEESTFSKAKDSLLVDSFIKSDVFSFDKFLNEETMIASDFPPEVIPENPAKKKKKKDSISEGEEESTDDFSFTDDEVNEKFDEVINSFFDSNGMSSVDDETKLKFIDKIKIVMEDSLEDGNQDQIDVISKFIDLLKKSISGEISVEEKKDLLDVLKALFPSEEGNDSQKESKQLKEDLLDQVNDVFGSAFGPIGSRLGDFFSVAKDIVSELANSDDKDFKRDIEDDEKEKGFFNLEKFKSYSSEKKDEKEKEDAKKLKPEEFHKKYGKCPPGYNFDKKQNACVKVVSKKKKNTSKKPPVPKKEY